MKKNSQKWWQKTAIYLTFILSFYLTANKANLAKAQSLSDIPSELIELTTKIDLAANNQDLETLSQYISPEFQSNDGLNYDTFTQSLNQLWSKYPNLTYQTRVESWSQEQDQLVATTITYIQGNLNSDGREMNLVSEIKAKYYFQDDKLIKQEILTEKTDITSGEKPPEIIIKLPEKVRAGSEFDFDVIVKEPLDNDLLLGGVEEKEATGEIFLDPVSLELDALSAGGIFKRITIPDNSKDLLYSVILIRADGLRLFTQRVKVEN